MEVFFTLLFGLPVAIMLWLCMLALIASFIEALQPELYKRWFIR